MYYTGIQQFYVANNIGYACIHVCACISVRGTGNLAYFPTRDHAHEQPDPQAHTPTPHERNLIETRGTRNAKCHAYPNGRGMPSLSLGLAGVQWHS